MATRSRKPVMNVDLSQVVSQYIGETEKNLDRLFEEAERTGAVLQFDEADELFASNSESGEALRKWVKGRPVVVGRRLPSGKGFPRGK